MKKIVFILNIFFCFQSFGQHYHWNLAMSTGICPLTSRTYPYDINLINDNVLEPISIETDKQGNLYVLGSFRPLSGSWANEYQITPTKKIYATEGANLNALYIYKLSAKGEVLWANSISNMDQPMGDFTSNTELSVNPYSGKVYIIVPALGYINFNTNYVNTNLDNSVTIQKRMMICLNADGTYNKTISSAAVLNKPIFSSEKMGVIKRSKIAEFYPWPDSASFFKFDAQKDSLLNYQFANGERIISYNEKQKVYVTDVLSEYDVNLIKTKGNAYNHSHMGSIVSNADVIEYKKDKSGNHYFHYLNFNRNSGTEELYYLLKLDKTMKRVWVHASREKVVFQMDTFNNPWLKVYSGSFYLKDSKPNTYPRHVENPSEIYLIKLDSLTGDVTNNTIVPTNLIQQTNLPGQFKITQNNEFWIAGLLFNEAEFGNYSLSMKCNGDYLPLQHYVARAIEGWNRDRKNLSDKKLYINGLNLYPNPANTYLNIQNENNIAIQNVEIYNTIGVKQSVNLTDFNIPISIEHLNLGMYFVKITINHTTQILTFIKQ